MQNDKDASSLDYLFLEVLWDIKDDRSTGYHIINRDR